jgi:hypothetical protein
MPLPEKRETFSRDCRDPPGNVAIIASSPVVDAGLRRQAGSVYGAAVDHRPGTDKLTDILLS